MAFTQRFLRSIHPHLPQIPYRFALSETPRCGIEIFIPRPTGTPPFINGGVLFIRDNYDFCAFLFRKEGQGRFVRIDALPFLNVSHCQCETFFYAGTRSNRVIRHILNIKRSKKKKKEHSQDSGSGSENDAVLPRHPEPRFRIL